MSTVEQRLAGIVYDYWKVPKREGGLFLHLMLQSKSSRAIFARDTLRALHTTHLFRGIGIQNNHPSQAFETTLTPAFWIALVEDLRVMQQLSTVQAQMIEACILDTVSAQGTWKAI